MNSNGLERLSEDDKTSLRIPNALSAVCGRKNMSWRDQSSCTSKWPNKADGFITIGLFAIDDPLSRIAGVGEIILLNLNLCLGDVALQVRFAANDGRHQFSVFKLAKPEFGSLAL